MASQQSGVDTELMMPLLPPLPRCQDTDTLTLNILLFSILPRHVDDITIVEALRVNYAQYFSANARVISVYIKRA